METREEGIVCSAKFVPRHVRTDDKLRKSDVLENIGTAAVARGLNGRLNRVNITAIDVSMRQSLIHWCSNDYTAKQVYSARLKDELIACHIFFLLKR